MSKQSSFNPLPFIVMALLPYLVFFDFLLDVELPDFLAHHVGIVPVYGIMIFVVVCLWVLIRVIRMSKAGAKPTEILLWDMIAKLCYIPFFLFVFAAGTLISALPLVGLYIFPVLFLMDTAFLVPTAICGIAGGMRLLKTRNGKKGFTIAMMICHFIFIVDVIAAIALYNSARKDEKRKSEHE